VRYDYWFPSSSLGTRENEENKPSYQALAGAMALLLYFSSKLTAES
jgi:hypothetical protein